MIYQGKISFPSDAFGSSKVTGPLATNNNWPVFDGTFPLLVSFFGNVIRFAEESSRFLIDFRTIKFVGFLHSVEGKSNELSSVKLNVKLMSKPVYPN